MNIYKIDIKNQKYPYFKLFYKAWMINYSFYFISNAQKAVF